MRDSKILTFFPMVLDAVTVVSLMFPYNYTFYNVNFHDMYIHFEEKPLPSFMTVLINE